MYLRMRVSSLGQVLSAFTKTRPTRFTGLDSHSRLAGLLGQCKFIEKKSNQKNHGSRDDDGTTLLQYSSNSGPQVPLTHCRATCVRHLIPVRLRNCSPGYGRGGGKEGCADILGFNVSFSFQMAAFNFHTSTSTSLT